MKPDNGFRASHEQFRKSGGFVSLWLGNFANEEALDYYLSQQFPRDFGFEIYRPDGPEADVEETPLDIDTLIRRHSCGETFVAAAVQATAANGWKRATTAIVFYNFEYDPAFIAPNLRAPVEFIGVLRYPGFGT